MVVKMPELSHRRFLSKLKSIRGIRELLQKATLLYVLLIDGDTPAWVKAAVITALAYLVDPIDAVPDVAPFVGYLDDFAVISAAIAALKSQIKPKHIVLAKDMYREI